MFGKKVDSGLVTYDMKNEEQQENGNGYTQVITLIVCLIIYISIMEFQKFNDSKVYVNGLAAQIQVVISTFMVMYAKRRGLICANLINLIASFMATVAYFMKGNSDVIPGILVPICTIITINVIYFFQKQLNNKIEEVTKQKGEISKLYNDVVLNEKLISEKNNQLIKYNEALKENEEKLSYLAFFDVLTNIPNRKMINNRLDSLIELGDKQKLSFAVVFIDLDNFKKINDSRGHHIGDLLLKEVTSKLNSVIHPKDMLGRLGGDEFALIIERNLNKDEIFEYVKQVKDVLIDFFIIENNEFNITASMGISIYPENGKSSMELLRCADTAMYKAKEYGKNGIQFFTKEINDDIIRKTDLENKLLAAIKNEEIYLAFQPQYTSNSKKLRGFEALARWNSPKLGVISPGEFIPVAEETGLIIQLGEFIIRSACEKFKYIQNKYNINSVISINISAVQIMDPCFIQMVKKILEETKFNPEYLEFEITESVFISSIDYVTNILKELKELGVKVALDDFGTGYSSLNYLQLLPIDTLKIDKSFIDRIKFNNEKNQIVGSIISLVHQLGISVVAEGIEEQTQLEYLKKCECDFIQGFLWGKPLEQEEVIRLILNK